MGGHLIISYTQIQSSPSFCCISSEGYSSGQQAPKNGDIDGVVCTWIDGSDHHAFKNVSTSESFNFNKFIQEIADRGNLELVRNGLPEFAT
jgi:hypothetical protein